MASIPKKSNKLNFEMAINVKKSIAGIKKVQSEITKLTMVPLMEIRKLIIPFLITIGISFVLGFIIGFILGAHYGR